MIYYCYSIKKGLFDNEMAYAKELGIYIFYDEDKDDFFDKDGIRFDIKDKKIFPRTGVFESKTLMDAIIRHKGHSLVTSEDYDKTINWPNYIKTKRNKIIISGREILENPSQITKVFGNNQVFFKTKEKNFAEIVEISEIIKSESALSKAIKEHLDEEFIISDVVSIEQDQHGLLEYRAFVVNNQIMNISRVSSYLLSTVPGEIVEKLNNVISNLKETDFPKSYVIDCFIYKNELGIKEIDILECNPIVTSGLYLYNSVFEYQHDLTHKCPSASIPKEKLRYGQNKYYGFNVVETRNPSICYRLPGGFAADLTAITFFGEKSSKGMYIHFSPSNICLPNFDKDEELEIKKLKKKKK